MSILILKGQGVFYHKPVFDEEGNPVIDPETGEQEVRLVPYTQPSRYDVNPFCCDPETGDLLPEIEDGTIPHRWPIEGAAHKVALDFLKQHKDAGYSYEVALWFAKLLMNKSAEMLNEKLPKEHQIPLYFDDSGKLNKEWATVNPGWYPKEEHSELSLPYNEHGLITFFMNNRPHPTFGHGLESGAFPSSREFGELVGHGAYKRQALENGTYIPTRLGSYGGPHIEPHDMLLNMEGDEGPVKRFTSTDVDPLGEYYSTEGELAARENLDVNEIFSGLDPSFYHSKEHDEGTENATNVFLDQHGYDEPTALSMARTVAGSFFNEGRVRGARSAVNTHILDLTGRIMDSTGKSSEDVKRAQQELVRGYRAIGMDRVGVHNSNGNKLLEALAISQIARELGVDTDKATIDPRIAEAFHGLTEGQTGRIMDRTTLPTREVDLSHLTDETMEIPPDFSPASEAGNPSLDDKWVFGTGRSPGQEGEVATSDGSLYDLMESLQMVAAHLDSELLKGLPPGRDYETLIEHFSLTANDIRFIEESVGDWHGIAKTLMIDPHVVSLIKVSRGAII